MSKPDDPTWSFDVSKMLGDMKAPVIDMAELVVSQRKNIEALSNANKLAFDGIQAVARRQADVMRQMHEELSSMVSELMSASSPEERISKQADLAKATYEKVLGNMKELAEMLANSNTEAAEVITSRISESLDELKSMATKPHGPGPGRDD